MWYGIKYCPDPQGTYSPALRWIFRQRYEGILSIKCKLQKKQLAAKEKRCLHCKKQLRKSFQSREYLNTEEQVSSSLQMAVRGRACLQCFCDGWCSTGWMSSWPSGYLLLSSWPPFSSCPSCNQSPKVLCSALRSLLCSPQVTSFTPMASTWELQPYLVETICHWVQSLFSQKSAYF